MNRNMKGLVLIPMAALLVACGTSQSRGAASTQEARDSLADAVDLDAIPADNALTRAEMAILLLKQKHGLTYRPMPAVGGFFKDVADYWAESWIEQLVTEGIGSGYPDGSFRPDDPVTRAEAAVFLLKAKHGSGYSPPPAMGFSFADTAGHWAEAWIEQLKTEGLSAGYPDGTYRPEEPLTAGELGVIIRGIFE